MYDNRDSIDFGKEPIGKLFRKMFFPTMVGMISIVVLNITDGAFVGHGVGSDGLAAVNIIAPLFMVMGGIGMMFGIGGSVVASIHLSKGENKAANINVTQALCGGTFVGVILSIILLTHLRETCILFGANERLVPLASSYLVWLAALMPLWIISNVGMYMVRLDGSPKLAMSVTLVAAILNIIGDYLLIFVFDMGLEGASIATSVSFALGGLVVPIYMLFFSKTLKLHKLKLSKTSLLLNLRNLWYQVRIGASAFLGEIAIAAVTIIGNHQFIIYLGEDGVAAFSIGCYCLPIAFMLGNAIVQSSQPIISFAYGNGERQRAKQTFHLTIRTALIGGFCGMLVLAFGAKGISTTFLPPTCHAWSICVEGLPYFSLCFLFICVNIVWIGYYQSMERAKPATIYTLLRGFVFMIPAFIIMPILFGTNGLWLAQAVAEFATFLIILFFHNKAIA